MIYKKRLIYQQSRNEKLFHLVFLCLMEQLRPPLYNLRKHFPSLASINLNDSPNVNPKNLQEKNENNESNVGLQKIARNDSSKKILSSKKFF